LSCISKGKAFISIFVTLADKFSRNASSSPPRLPFLSQILKSLISTTQSTRYTIVALSYRGYWTSTGRPSQLGIERDAIAAVHWIHQTLFDAEKKQSIVLWGQSIGAGIATTTLAEYLKAQKTRLVTTDKLMSDDGPNFEKFEGMPLPVSGLILETPFTSIRDMLVALYPQKWLPYRYLGPFLRNSWDSTKALHEIKGSMGSDGPRVMILSADKDELVPPEHALKLENICAEYGMDVRHRAVRGALHTEAMAREEGRSAVVHFLREIGKYTP
jgi:uncharacterized protein